MPNKNENIEFLSKCFFCGSRLDQGDLIILEEQDRRTVFHISCAQCGTSSISILSSGQAGIVSLGMETDLDKDEVKSKFLKKTISADEVIDMHEFIERKQGNLIELIKNSK